MSSRERTPIAFVADPRMTGTSLPSPMAARSALMTTASSSVPSSRYRARRSSSVSATASTSFSRASCTASARSAGMSVSSIFPGVSPTT